MTVILLVILIFFILSFKKPAWAIACLMALLPTYLIRFTLFGLPTTLLELLLLSFLVGFLINRPDLRKILNLGKINWAVGLFVLAAIIATIVSPEKTKALGELKAFFVEPVLLFYAAVILLSEKKNLKLTFRSLFFSSSLISLFGLIQYFTYLGLPIQFWGTGLEPERITSVFDYPNALALFLAPLFGLFLTLTLKKYQLFEQKWITWLGLGLMAGALILIFSRGAWLAVGITSIFLLIRNRQGKKILAVLGLFVLTLLLITPIRQRVGSSLADPSSQAHLELMIIGINKITQSPFLGNGLYGFRTTLQQANFNGEILNYPHNIFLNFWSETGLLGLIAFCWIIQLAINRQKNKPSVEAVAAVVFLLITIIHGLVDVPYFKNDLSILFWFAISLFYI